MVVRFTGYGFLGVCCQVSFTSLYVAFLEPGSAASVAPDLSMFWLFGAGGLFLDGADELLRVPTPLRAAGLVVCIYALGYGVGWGLQQVGGDFPWDGSGRGFTSNGRIPIEQAPYWFLLALGFRNIRHGLDRVEAALRAAPPTAHRQAPVDYRDNAPAEFAAP
jgi:hypothetical protein